MRVAVFTPSFLPIYNMGVAQVVLENITFLKKMFDIDFDIYTLSPGKRTKYRGSNIYRFFSKPFPVYKIAPSMIKLLKDVNVIHTHQYGYWPATAGMISSIISKRPLVFTPHYHPPIYGEIKKYLNGLYYFTQAFPIFETADVVLPITNFEKELLSDIFVDKKKMRVIPNPVDTHLFKPIGSKDEHNIILFVSRIEKYKGADIFFDISQDILNDNEELRKILRFVFIGIGRLRDELRSKARKTYPKNYVFIKFANRRKLVEWYSRSRVLVLPSKYEAFGMVLAEAMSCGTPVVATKVGGIPEVVGDCGRLVEYGDWDKMKEYIIKIINMPESRYKKLSGKCRKRVVKKFDSKIVAEKLYKLYSLLQ